MKTEIIRIGNSQGIRLPKAVLDQCGLQGAVELEVAGDRIIIHSAGKPRAGWEEAFKAMSQQGDDRLLDKAGLIANEFDEAEWEW